LTAAPTDLRASPWSSRAAIFLLLLAVATRFVALDNPIANPDDQFYLMVGDAMRHGNWPYIDIWDRKPFGLFALFAGIASIGGASILVMNLIALLFAFATALVIRRISLIFTRHQGATLAGAAYLVALPMFSGQTAQAPIFFNLPMVLAALALFRAVKAAQTAIARLAFLAMLCCGLAISLKPVAVVEGAYFGLAFLWLMHRRGISPVSIAGNAALMILIALLPTLIPMFGYAAAGSDAFRAFFHANFVSIFQKTSLGLAAQKAGLFYFLLFMGPLIAFAALGLVERLRDDRDVRARLLLGWLVAALGGYLIVPQFYDQYALPLIAPLSVCSAIPFDRRRIGVLMSAALVAFCLMAGQITAWSKNRAEAETYARLSRAVNEARHGGCILVNEGPTWLYRSTGACRLTRFLFPGHLNLATEVNSVGVDTVVETRRILARRPAVITFQPSTAARHNPVTERLLRDALRGDYQLVAMIGPDASPSLATLQVWQRRDLGPVPIIVPDLSRPANEF
jgi:4-amino-4-deoxy-L-arabinose transferase-like glycosyltransferase